MRVAFALRAVCSAKFIMTVLAVTSVHAQSFDDDKALHSSQVAAAPDPLACNGGQCKTAGGVTLSCPTSGGPRCVSQGLRCSCVCIDRTAANRCFGTAPATPAAPATPRSQEALEQELNAYIDLYVDQLN